MKLFQFLTISSIFLGSLSMVAQPPIESIDNIRAAASNFLESATAEGNAKVTFQLGGIDPRLRLAKCDQPLIGFLPNNAKLKANTIVGVRCVGAKSWHIYIATHIKVEQQVMVFKKNLKRGHVISKSDLEQEWRDTTMLRAAPVTELSEIVGSVLKRNVQMDQTASSEYACMVCRGDKLLIVAGQSSLSVTMEGEALEDGRFGEHIQVKNLTSSRLLAGKVIAKNKVAVGIN
ncbi:MAG: flagellar basal body P-ring formation chaperone FlgA [Kangiellaceae bacterium]|jgi:flagella basal body P-ring formation protein FlgA|nr:flagellar basal body P-ring formation chaperone FlgA [Kangiellaceae bacterium]